MQKKKPAGFVTIGELAKRASKVPLSHRREAVASWIAIPSNVIAKRPLSRCCRRQRK
jgi:hypothetical protein